jgi:hypothetical protein
MKKTTIFIYLLSFFATSEVIAQQPVKQELAKLVGTIVVPPQTPSEAFTNCEVNGEVDGQKMFGDFYDRMEKVVSDIYSLTEKQSKKNKTDHKASVKAVEDGFGEMSTSEQARYMKSNPALQNATGVSASMMEFAAKMEDPAFKKKFDAMSDAEKAKLVMEYQQPQVQLSRKQHTQTGLKTVMEAGTLLSQFNEEYRGKTLMADCVIKEKDLDKKEQERLTPVQAEKNKLSAMIGKGSADWVGKKYLELIAQEWSIRNETFEKKLMLYREHTLDLIASYKLAAKPFDDFLMKVNYGAELKAANEAKELAQLAGYQEGLLREIVSIQDLAKGITLQAAAFYKEKLAAEQSK